MFLFTFKTLIFFHRWIVESSGNGIYSIRSNARPNSLFLACDNNGNLSLSSSKKTDGWEGWKIEQAGGGIYFLTRGGYVLAFSDDGRLVTSKDMVPHGNEGLLIESTGKKVQPTNPAKPTVPSTGIESLSGVYYIASFSARNKVLSFNEKKSLVSSTDKRPDGPERYLT